MAAIKKPTFISGGTQEGRIVNISGTLYTRPNMNATSIFSGPTGLFNNPRYVTDYSEIGAVATSGTLTGRSVIDFSASRVVKTGPDVAPTNLSVRLWRRVS